MRRLLFILTVIYTALLITRPHEFVPALANSPLLQILILVMFGVWLCTPNKGTDLPQFRALPFFLIFVWLSLGAAGWWGGIVDALQKMLPVIFLFIAISGCVRTVSELRQYALVIIACACVLVFHGHLQVTTGVGWTQQPMIEGRITYSGIFNDPNDMGLLIVVSIALSIYFLRTCTARLARWLMLAALGWLLYGVYLTDSRGTMLATMFVVALELWRAYGRTVVLTLGAIAVPVLIAFTRLAALNAEEESAENRVEAWYDGIQYLTSHPIFGVGWGMFGDMHGMTAHNSIVLAMAELGLPGYVFWLAFVFLSGMMIYRVAYPSMPNPHHTPASRQADVTSLGKRRAVRAQRVKKSATLEMSQPTVEEVNRTAARYVAFAAAGFAVGAFFLSQSYKAMLFIVCGLIVGRYLGMREAGLAVPEFRLGNMLPQVIGVSLASIVGMWLLVRILL
jgi:O-antigen ligase